MKRKQLLMLVVSLFLIVSFVSAEDTESDMMQDYGPMGQPEEMKSLAWMVGEWDVVQEWKMDPASEKWEQSTATCTYSYILDGCVMKMDYDSEMMGIPFTGISYQTYDRILGQFQAIWIDNMSARMSYYTEIKDENKMIIGGDDYTPDGSKVLSRLTISNQTDTSFDWLYEMSMDEGKTYWTSGKAKYTKKK